MPSMPTSAKPMEFSVSRTAASSARTVASFASNFSNDPSKSDFLWPRMRRFFHSFHWSIVVPCAARARSTTVVTEYAELRLDWRVWVLCESARMESQPTMSRMAQVMPDMAKSRVPIWKFRSIGVTGVGEGRGSSLPGRLDLGQHQRRRRRDVAGVRLVDQGRLQTEARALGRPGETCGVVAPGHGGGGGLELHVGIPRVEPAGDLQVREDRPRGERVHPVAHDRAIATRHPFRLQEEAPAGELHVHPRAIARRLVARRFAARDARGPDA